MKYSIPLFVLLLCFTIEAGAKELIGRVEEVLVSQKNLLVKAKIDTGALNSSLNCDCKTYRKNNGETWIKLKITNYKGQSIQLDKPVVRQAIIKRHGEKRQIRDVIKLELCLGSVRKKVEVNLINRTGFNYQLLIGRSFLQGSFLIDVDKTYLTKPHCK